MSQIENLQIRAITDDILLLHQIKTPFYFSCCDGLLILPKKGRNTNAIALDLNIEPKYIQAINNQFGPVLEYVCSHSHMDHIAHVHEWERLGATIWAPDPESNCLIDLYNFYENFGFNETMDFSVVEQFGKINGYQKCFKVNSYKPGDALKFESFELKTIPLTGHSKAHVGFLLSADKIFHISCLGFDQPKPGVDGFGAFYGFRECSLDTYLNDIDKAELIYSKGVDFLTSSHSYIVKYPDKTPFEYIRSKIKENQKIIDVALANSKLSPNFEDKIQKLLKQDLYYPKRKMKGFLKKIYAFWEYWIIEKHLQRSTLLK